MSTIAISKVSDEYAKINCTYMYQQNTMRIFKNTIYNSDITKKLVTHLLKDVQNVYAVIMKNKL